MAKKWQITIETTTYHDPAELIGALSKTAREYGANVEMIDFRQIDYKPRYFWIPGRSEQGKEGK